MYSPNAQYKPSTIQINPQFSKKTSNTLYLRQIDTKLINFTASRPQIDFKLAKFINTRCTNHAEFIYTTLIVVIIQYWQFSLQNHFVHMSKISCIGQFSSRQNTQKITLNIRLVYHIQRYSTNTLKSYINNTNAISIQIYYVASSAGLW